MGGHSAVSLVVAIVLGLHSVAADCRVVGNVSDAPRISGNVSVADAPGILLEGHSQGVLTSGHKSAKRIHLHALAEGVDTTKLLGHDNATCMRGEGLAPSTTGRGQAHIVTAHGDSAYGGGFVPIPRGVPVLIGAGSSSGSPANGTERSSEQRCAVITGVTYECDTADVETLPGDAAVLIIGALVATYSHRMIGVTILWGALFESSVTAVCPNCFGNIASCTYDAGGVCPFVKSVSDNAGVVAGLAASAGAALTLTGLISSRFLRIFTRAHIQAIMHLVRRPAPGTIFEIKSDSKIKDILTAVAAGQVTMEQAAIAFVGFIDDETDDDRRKALTEKYKLITSTKDLSSFASGHGADAGVYSWLWGKITNFVSDRGMQVQIDTGAGSSSSSTAHVLTTTIKRFKDQTDFFESLNLFIMFATAIGLCSAVALTEFLEFTVFDTIRMRGYPWQVAQELMIVMLRRIEDSAGKLNIANCINDSYLNTVLDEAMESAKHHYGAAFFRQVAVGDRSRNGNADGAGAGTDHCKNGKFTSTSKECCAFWNTRSPHPPSAVDANGVCKKCHVCDHWVSNKGKNGRCMGEGGTPGHRRGACDNPHKCDGAQQ